MAEARGQGERRSRGWSAKEVIQGKPIRRPTHPFFVVFPIAFFSGAVVLDILGRLGLEGTPLAATYAVTAGLIGAVFAILTGLVDRSQMRPGSRIRAVATRHMVTQLTATAVFAIDLAVRWGNRHSANVSVLWLVLDVLGTAAVIAGGWAILATGQYWIDSALSFGIGALILWSSFGILRETLNILLEGTPRGMKLDRVEAAICEIDGVNDVHDLHVWSLSSELHALSAHVAVSGHPSLEQAQATGEQIKDLVGARFSIAHATASSEISTPKTVRASAASARPIVPVPE